MIERGGSRLGSGENRESGKGEVKNGERRTEWRGGRREETEEVKYERIKSQKERKGDRKRCDVDRRFFIGIGTVFS